MNFYQRLWLILLSVSVVFAQVDQSLVNAALQSGGTSGLDPILLKQLLAQQRNKTGTIQGQAGTIGQTDSSNLFLPGDTILMSPNIPDTLYYVERLDTIDADQVKGDTTIVDRLKRLASDPTKLVVRRKIPVDRKVIKGPERFEIMFFRSQPQALFSSTTNAINGDYPIKAGDKLVLTMWGELEKEYPLNVNNQGKVLLPGGGLISVAGLTLLKAEEILKQKLGKAHAGIAQNRTQVNLRLETLSPVKVFLVGEVSKPGGYVYYGNTTIFQALYLAGGPSELGSVREIQISREDTTFTLDLYDYLMHGKASEPSVLHDGDIVYLPRAKFLVEVQGDVGREAIYEMKAGEGIKELLEFGGGINASAANQKMLLLRRSEDGKPDYMDLETPKAFMAGGAKLELKNGDVVRVKKNTEAPSQYVTILGSVKYPGIQQFKESATVADVIAQAGGLKTDAFEGRIQVIRPKEKGGYKMSALAVDKASGISLQALDTILVYSAKEFHRPDSVLITGAIFSPGWVEYYEGMTVKDLILQAGGFRPNRSPGVVRVEHLKPETRGVDIEVLQITDNYDVDGSASYVLKPWDHVEIPVDPMFHRALLVTLAGGFKQPGRYALLQPGERIADLIKRTGGFHEDAFILGAKFYRKGGKIGFIAIDLQLALEGDPLHNLELQSFDSIFVPLPQVHVRVNGEVGFPTNVLYTPGKDAYWYISRAGGFKETSDEERVMIRYANGTVVPADDADRDPDPGSEIIVQYKEPPLPVDWFKVATTVATLITAAVGVLALIFKN